MPKQNTEEFLRIARERFRQSVDAESGNRQRMLEALRFRLPENQWHEQIKHQRDKEMRPCLSIDHLGKYVRQVSNDIRQNRPSGKVRPVDDNADVKTAEAYQGIIRQIERQSNADKVRGWAAEYAVSIGRGWYRIVTDYCDDESTDQDIFVKRIKNPFTVYPDPLAEEPDYSDMRWCFVRTRMPKDEFKAVYGDEKFASLEDWAGIGDTGDWIDDSAVYIAEYWCVETKSEKIKVEGRERTVERRKVCWYLISGSDVLEEREWAGRWIPIIPVLGEELDVEGETDLRGMIQRGMDAQRQYNYMRSAQVEAVALAPKAPFIAAEGQTENYQGEWAASNTKSIPVLRYTPVTVGGQVVGPPQRQTFEPAIQAITQAVMQATEDMKQTFGIFDAGLGNGSNEKSGKAILARQKESDTANFHYVDGINTAISHEFRVYLDLIPKIYDRPGRVVRMLGEAGDESAGVVGGDGVDPNVIPQGIAGIYDLKAGRYDVAVTIGPSYSTKRQEAAEALTQLAGMSPIVMDRAPDIVVKALDTPYSQELADRLTPPDVAQSKQTGMEPQVQAIMSQMQQQMESLQGFAQEQFQRVKQLESKEDIERERIALEREKFTAQMRLEEMKLGVQEAQFMLEQRLRSIESQMGQINTESQMDMQAQDSARQAELADRQQGLAETETMHGTAMAERQQDHSETMADRQQTFAETTAKQQAKQTK